MNTRHWCWTLGFALAACGGAGGEQAADDVVASPDVASGADPCGLVSQAEMEGLIGPMSEPPYRVDSNRQSDATGEGCLYRAKDGRNVTVLVDFEDGEMGFRMLAGTGKAVNDILVGYDAETDTLEGGWDKIGSAFGQLIVLKGKASVQVDPVGSRIGLPGAVRVASMALKRIEAPLAYDGAKAARRRPPPKTADRNPCDLVTRKEAEALMGALRSDPTPSSDGEGCDFAPNLEFMGSKVTRTLKVQWTDGYYALGQERGALEGGAKIMAAQMDNDIPSIGATTMDQGEPWDERVTLLGGLVTVVRQDAMLQIAGDGLGGFDEKKAIELLRIAARRL